MNLKVAITCIISFILCANSVNAETGIDFYRSFIEGFPSVQSYSIKSQALNFENQSLSKSRFLNPTATTLYSNYQTELAGVYSISDFSVANTIDLFNKVGIAKERNSLEIKRTLLLNKTERRTIFTRILNAYYSIVKNKYLLRTHEDNLVWIDRNISHVKKGIDAGIFPQNELARWEIEKLNQINRIETDKLEIIRAEETLRLYTGFDKIITEDISTNKIRNIDCSQISELDFIKNSPETETLSIDQKQIELEIKKENREIFPDLQVSDTFELSGDPNGNGNQNVVLAALNFKLPNGGKGARIKSAQNRIKGIELDKAAQIIILKNDFRGRIMEINSERTIICNFENALNISRQNLNKLLIGYQNRFIDYTTLINAVREQQSIQENYYNTLTALEQNYEYLYRLSNGDVY